MSSKRAFGRITAAAILALSVGGLSLGGLAVGLAASAGFAGAETAAKPKRAERSFASAPWIADYLRGRTAQLDHDWRTAGQAMRAAWEADRDNPQLRREALLLTLAGGDYQAAVAVAKAIPPDSGDGLLAKLILLTDDLAEGRFSAARARIDTVPQAGPERYLQPLLVAWSEVGQGRKAQALAALAPLESAKGAAELYMLQSAMISEALGDKGQAGALYEKLLLGKPSTRALVLAAEFYVRQGAPEKAKAALERLDPDGASSSIRTEMLARLDARSVSVPKLDAKSGAGAAMFEIAASLALDERVDMGPLLYTRLALRLAPNFPQAQMLLADLDRRWGRIDDAIAVLQAVDPASAFRSTADREAMADALKNDDLDLALKIGKAASEAHKADLDLAIFYADLLRQKQRYGEAIAIYDRVLGQVSPTSSRKGLALYHRGIAYERSHDWPRAEADLNAALLLRPDDAGLLNYLAFSWADQGINLDRARTMLERAIQLQPDDGAIVDSLGWVMYRQGDYDEAIKQLERAVELDSGDATVNDHLGDAYWQAGRKIEARSQWERALRQTDDTAQAEQIRAKLNTGVDSNSPKRAAAN